jgi:hypothetical protein
MATKLDSHMEAFLSSKTPGLSSCPPAPSSPPALLPSSPPASGVTPPDAAVLLSKNELEDKQIRELLSKNRSDFNAWKTEYTCLSAVEAKKLAIDAVKYVPECFHGGEEEGEEGTGQGGAIVFGVNSFRVQLKALEEENKKLKREVKSGGTRSGKGSVSPKLPEAGALGSATGTSSGQAAKKSKTVKATSKRTSKSKRRAKVIAESFSTEILFQFPPYPYPYPPEDTPPFSLSSLSLLPSSLLTRLVQFSSSPICPIH